MSCPYRCTNPNECDYCMRRMRGAPLRGPPVRGPPVGTPWASSPCASGNCGVPPPVGGPPPIGPPTPYGPSPYGQAAGPLAIFSDPGIATSCVSRPIIGPPTGRPLTIPLYRTHYLVSCRDNESAHNDEMLINPWGIGVYDGRVYVVNGTTDTVTKYDMHGNKELITISVRDAAHNSSHPTGIAFNCGGGFVAANEMNSSASQFIVCTEHGTVHAYAPNVNVIKTVLVLNSQLTGMVTVYKGLCIARNYLYLADFFGNKIDVFDNTYARQDQFINRFKDGDTSDPIPLDFAPNNIVHYGCYIYVIYARKNPNVTVHDLDGAGNGYISVFNLDGAFERRFTSRGALNSPWAMIPAPCECGIPPGSFLVGNNGDGRINIYDCQGVHIGPLLTVAGVPVTIPGLWGLAPYYTPTEGNSIFFTASSDENRTGMMGKLTRESNITITV